MSEEKEYKPYGLIYKITNLINGKSYIGQTIKEVKYRWREHVNEANTRARFPLHKAIKKYGPENFNIEIICYCPNQVELNYKEKENTDYFNAWIGKGGYTCKAGDGIGSVSEETKKKHSVASTGRKHSEESKKKASLSKLGDKNPNFGKPLTEETKRKMSLSSRGHKKSEETRKRIALAKIGDKNPNFGKIESTETRIKKSIAMSGRKNHQYGKIRDEQTLEKMSKAQVKKIYHVISPLGEPITLKEGVIKFCKERGLTPPSMYAVLNNKNSHHKGWRLNKNV